MRYLILALLLSGCATSYKNARRWEYIGNSQYLVSAGGNGYTGKRTAQSYLMLAAAEACYVEEKKGFRLAAERDISTLDSAGAEIYTRPGFTATVVCEGEPDPRMIQRLQAAKE